MKRGRRIIRKLAIATGLFTVALVALGVSIHFGYRGESQLDVNSGKVRRVGFMFGVALASEQHDSALLQQLDGWRVSEDSDWRRLGSFDLYSSGSGLMHRAWRRANDIAEWVKHADFSSEARTANARNLLLALRIGNHETMDWPYIDAMEKLRIQVESRPYWKQRVEIEDLPTVSTSRE